MKERFALLAAYIKDKFAIGKKSGKEKRKSMLLSIVALVEVLAIAIVSVSAWVETISTVKIDLNNGTIDNYVFTNANIGYGDGYDDVSIDLTKYFRQAGNVHLSSASSADGQNIYLPSLSSNGTLLGYRKATINDKNVNYIDFSFNVTAKGMDASFYFAKIPTIKVGDNAENSDNVRVSFVCESTNAVVCATKKSTNVVISGTTSTDMANENVNSFKDYLVTNDDRTELFTVPKESTRKVTMRVWLQDKDRTITAGQSVTITDFELTTKQHDKTTYYFSDKTTGDSELGISWATKNNRNIWVGQGGNYKLLAKKANGNYSVELGNSYTDNPTKTLTFYSCESSVTSNPQNDYVAKWETTLQEGADKSSNTFTAYGYIDKNNSNKGYGTWEEVQQIALSSDEDTDILPMEQVNGSNLDVTMYVNDTPIAMTLYVDENVKYNKYICYIPVSVNTDNIRFEFTNNGVTYTVKAPKRNDSVHFVVTSATTGYWEPPAIVSVYSPCIDDKDNDAKMGVVSVSGGVEGATRVKVTKGTTVTLTAEAKSDKYRFMGWYSDASFSGEPISTDMQYSFVASDTTNEYMYYAKFARQYKVEVIVLTNNVKNTDGGTVKVTDDKGIESEYFLEGQNVTLTATPNKEYTFSGWYLNNDDQSGSALYKSDAKFEIIGINSDYKYYAHFDIKTFSVTATAIRQDDNNKSEVEFTSPEKGPDATVTVTVNYGESATFKANPSTGYKFDGWYSDENCGAESFVSNNNPYTMNNITDDSNSTLYAKFSIIMCDVKVYGVTDGNITETGGTLKYNSDDPAGKIEQKVAYGTTVTLVAKANDGYKFAGWYTDQTCKTQAGEDIIGNYDYTADSITTAKITKNITLYAKFESLTVKTTIYFESRDWSKYNAYVYSSSDGGTWIEAWPGKQELSKDAVTGYYKYEFETDKFTGKFRVIVNDGNGNQYPASNDPGLEGTLGKTYLFRKGSPSALEEFDPNEKISIKLVDETSAGWIHNDTPIMRLCLSDGTYIDLASTNTQKEWVWENVPIYATSFTIKRINKDNTNEVWNTWDTGDRDSNTTYKVADNSSYWQ